jgi:hypothetical protein
MRRRVDIPHPGARRLAASRKKRMFGSWFEMRNSTFLTIRALLVAAREMGMQDTIEPC